MRASLVEHALHDGLLGIGSVANVVPLLLQLLQHRLDGVEHIQVRGRADVSLVGGEGEDGDRDLLFLVLLVAKVRARRV